MGEKARLTGAVLAAVLLGLAFAVVMHKPAESAPSVVWNDPTLERSPVPTIEPSPGGKADHSTAAADCGPPAAKIVYGKPIEVTLPGAPPFAVGKIPAGSWTSPPSADPTWRLNFLSLLWIKPLARKAALDGGFKSFRSLIDQVVAFHTQNPDPGTNANGWDEGTALRRLETENCLYTLSHSPALKAGMAADAAVLLGYRYYGPPRHHVHNHGLFANLRLIRAAALIGRPDWAATAIRRITSEQSLAFSAAGMTYEQSSMYQKTNADLWNQAVSRLPAGPAAAVRATVDTAYRAYGWLTEPDGRIVQIGDSQRIAGRRIDLGATRTLRDDGAGWLVGRWSWTDPQTSYYTVRYGPPRFAHGHQDRAGGVTWTTRGLRVLVGPGVYTYDPKSDLEHYGIGPEGQNVAVPDGGQPHGKAPAKITKAVQDADGDHYTERDEVYGSTHIRDIDVSDSKSRIQVADSFPNERTWNQHWHLDPQWKLVSSTSRNVVFAGPFGHKLTVSTTGRVSDVLRAVDSPPHGWQFPAFGVKVPNAEIVIQNRGRVCITTFTVS